MQVPGPPRVARMAAAAACTLRLALRRDSFLSVPSSLAHSLHLQQGHVVVMSWGTGQEAFLGWLCQGLAAQHDQTVEIGTTVAFHLNLRDGQEVLLTVLRDVPSCQQVLLEPLTLDDFEILELHAAELEEQLLNQVRVVYVGMTLSLWINQSVLVNTRVVSLMPFSNYGRLEVDTRLLVEPKYRHDVTERDMGTSAIANTGGAGGGAASVRDDTSVGSDEARSGRSSAHVDSASKSNTEAGGGVAARNQPDLWSSMWSWFTSALWQRGDASTLAGAAAEDKTVSRWRPSDFDGVYRVTRVAPATPGERGQLQAANAVVVFPSGVREGNAATWFAEICRLASPKERKEKAKKRSAASKGDGKKSPSEEEEREDRGAVPCIVRATVAQPGNRAGDCEGCDSYWASEPGSRSQLHTGMIWVPELLRCRLQLEASSTVQLKAATSQPAVALAVELQPLLPLDASVCEDTVYQSWLSWLKLCCMDTHGIPTAKCSEVELNISGQLKTFSLAVVKHKRISSDHEPSYFILSHKCLFRSSVKVTLCPSEKGWVICKQTEDLDHQLPFIPLERLGGVEQAGRRGELHVLQSLGWGHLFSCLGAPWGLHNGGLLITGPKGSGKTALARAICKQAAERLDGHLEIISCKSLRGKATETIAGVLEAAMREAVWRQPSLLLLDDLHLVLGSTSNFGPENNPEDNQALQLTEVFKQLLCAEMSQRSMVALVCTAESEGALHRSLVSAQGLHVFQLGHDVAPLTREDGQELLAAVIRNKSSVSARGLSGAELQEVAKLTGGFLARDVVQLVERAVHAHLQANAPPHGDGTPQGLNLSTEDLRAALRGFTPSSLCNANLHEPSGLGWDSVGGLAAVKQVLMDTVQLPAKYPALFERLPIRQQTGVLLYGAPGTGKTLLAAAVAHESGMNFISIKGPELLNKYVGSSEQAVRDVFKRAQAAKPCVLFFDEFDSLAPRRGHDNTGVTDRVVNQLLTQLDGVEGLHGVYVLAASSRPDLIDPALLRPGRLDQTLFCPPPSLEERLEILHVLSRPLVLAEDACLQPVAEQTVGFTGADLKALLYNAQMEAINSLQADAFVVNNNNKEGAAGSETDSLSSMLFPATSGGSEESGPESGLEPSLTSLDACELLPAAEEPPLPDVWRLYFGSSYESEMGNGLSSELATQEASLKQQLQWALGQSVLYMPSLQQGFCELSPTETDSRRAELSLIVENGRAVHGVDIKNGETQADNEKTMKRLQIKQSHLLAALASTCPSISSEDWAVFNKLYKNIRGCQENSEGDRTRSPLQRVTLA
ncbi:peroxisomal ATPase PEX1 isoform X2 [Lethenteron reissneri]|uniref:peroxisomal ATPase PEX1 isoform X2 n=1 Tax=Lethenteron reissneri TaxID=7753 RepID=UPI002AB73A8C|nr:peroxisomal ATPase PEX1 isoform X2 [Lethenteron reissneri]